jgi:uncharacterized protein (TIGR02284 family)
MDESTLKRLNSLIQLDIDASDAYGKAIEHIDESEIASRLRMFRADHERHIDDLSQLVANYGGKPPKRSADLKGMLIEGFTALRSASGTDGALKAMETNEKMTTGKYRDAQSWSVPADVKAVLEANLDDEVRHLEYIQSQLHVTA